MTDIREMVNMAIVVVLVYFLNVIHFIYGKRGFDVVDRFLSRIINGCAK